MAEFSGFWTTGGATGDQQAVGYTQAQWSTACAILAAASGFEGVAPGYGNELAATDAGGGDIEIDTGGAVVDGKWYDSTSAVTVNIPTPAAGNERIDRIVARCTWAGFIVRITRIAGIAAPIPVAPAITQTSGAIYDIALWQARITDGGVIALTDERTWAGAKVDGVTLQSVAGVLSIADDGVDTAQLADNAVTSDKIANNAVTSDKIAGSAVTSDKIANNAVTSDKIANNAVTSDKIAGSAVTSDKIADNAVTSDKIASNAVTPAKIANRTREVFIPVDSGDAGFIGDQRGIHLPKDVETQVYGHGIIPRDFAMNAELVPVICKPSATSGAGLSTILECLCVLAGNSEEYDTHTKSTIYYPQETPLDTITFLAALPLPNAATGDTLGIVFKRRGNTDSSDATFYLRGFILRYTADS